MPETHDPEVARKAQAGDLEAFAILVRTHQQSVFNSCLRMLGNHGDAEDMTQEAFLRAYLRLHLFDPERPFGPWVRRLAVNLCLNALESRKPALVELDDEVGFHHQHEASTPEAQHLKQERSQVIQAALQKLPPHYRAVIELRHYQELSYSDMADVLNLPISDVKSHLFRARQKLAEWLNAYA